MHDKEVLLLLRLPLNLARVAAFLILFFHAVAAGTWMLQLGWSGYLLALGWLVLASWALGWCWHENDTAGPA